MQYNNLFTYYNIIRSIFLSKNFIYKTLDMKKLFLMFIKRIKFL
jgi:hypothetical protein